MRSSFTMRPLVLAVAFLAALVASGCGGAVVTQLSPGPSGSAPFVDTSSLASQDETGSASPTAALPGWKRFKGLEGSISLPPNFDSDLKNATTAESLRKGAEAEGASAEHVATLLKGLDQYVIAVCDSSSLGAVHLSQVVVACVAPAADASRLPLSKLVDRGLINLSEGGLLSHTTSRRDISIGGKNAAEVILEMSNGSQWFMCFIRGSKYLWYIRFAGEPAFIQASLPDLRRSVATFETTE